MIIYALLNPQYHMKEIKVDREIIDFIKMNGKDYRVSTSCYGPVILPIEMKSPKDTDIRIPVGKNTLYVSIVQAKYIDRVTKSMLYDSSFRKKCSLF
jgi:hypothetical protein